MTSDGMAIFDLAEKRLDWIDRRQALLAQNIANASTPGYVARDLTPFAQSLARAAPELAVTSSRHLNAENHAGPTIRDRPPERAPDGNAVSMHDQLTKVADTDAAHAMAANLYRRYLGFFRIVIGK